jgi:hypothetical protein
MSRPRRSRIYNSEKLGARFPIEQGVRYERLRGSKVLANGMGKTLEISSREVRFTTEQPLKTGERVQLSVDWPARLHDTCLMKLVIRGWVTSSEPTAAAVAIAQYEFRTRRGTALEAGA